MRRDGAGGFGGRFRRARTAPRVWAIGMFGRMQWRRRLCGVALVAAVEGFAVLGFHVAVRARPGAMVRSAVPAPAVSATAARAAASSACSAAAGATSRRGAIARNPSRSVTSTIRARRRRANRKPSPTPTSRSPPSWSWAAAWPIGSPTAWKTRFPIRPMSRSCARTSLFRPAALQVQERPRLVARRARGTCAAEGELRGHDARRHRPPEHPRKRRRQGSRTGSAKNARRTRRSAQRRRRAEDRSGRRGQGQAEAHASAKGVIEFRSDQWDKVYSRRIDKTIAALKSRGVPVFWVGLPSIRGTKSTADAVYLNNLYRARAQRAGIVYIDVWDGFVDDAGKYSSYGPDYEGQTRRLRSGDGVFFTKYGARKLAHYVEREIRRYMTNRVTTLTLPTGPFGPTPGGQIGGAAAGRTGAAADRRRRRHRRAARRRRHAAGAQRCDRVQRAGQGRRGERAAGTRRRFQVAARQSGLRQAAGAAAGRGRARQDRPRRRRADAHAPPSPASRRRSSAPPRGRPSRQTPGAGAAATEKSRGGRGAAPKRQAQAKAESRERAKAEAEAKKQAAEQKAQAEARQRAAERARAEARRR